MFADPAPSALPPPARAVLRRPWRGGHAGPPAERVLAEEVAVAVNYGATTHAVLMATPSDLDDFAVGFSMTEGIIRCPEEIAALSISSCTKGIILRMRLSGERAEALAARSRRLVGASGCGMCGLESLAEATRTIPAVSAGYRASSRDIAEAVNALPEGQTLNRHTRAVHAAAFWQAGRPLIVREDVGRHNALDKLAGALLRAGCSATAGVVVMSSRISIELVQKAGMMGASILVGVSAPTALAVRTAEAMGLTLVGIARDDGFEVFACAERVAGAGSAELGVVTSS